MWSVRYEKEIFFVKIAQKIAKTLRNYEVSAAKKQVEPDNRKL